MQLRLRRRALACGLWGGWASRRHGRDVHVTTLHHMFLTLTAVTQLKRLTNQPCKNLRRFLSFPVSSDPPASLSAKRPLMTIHLCHVSSLPSQDQANIQARLLQLQLNHDEAALAKKMQN